MTSLGKVIISSYHQNLRFSVLARIGARRSSRLTLLRPRRYPGTPRRHPPAASRRLEQTSGCAGPLPEGHAMPVNAFIFPGQGSQSVGMGQDLAAAFGAARDVFDEVDETLGQRLSKLMFEGPTEELTLTENAQPALMAVSLAVMRVLEREGGLVLPQKAALVAGHSLGEYSALAAAGSLQLAETARLLRLRGTAMQRAVPAGEGAMAALLGTE